MSDLESGVNLDKVQDQGLLLEDIDLTEITASIWEGKWLITLVICVCSAISVFYALSLPNYYRASALLEPAESSGGGLSGLVRQYGGLASLAGVSLPSGSQGSRAQLGMQLMKSRKFISDFIERRNLLPELMAGESWDPVTRQLNFNVQIYDAETGLWAKQALGLDVVTSESSLVFQTFVSGLNISQDSKTGYVTISIDHRSPDIAAKWVEWLVDDVNSAVKSQEVAEATQSITFLREQVQRTSLKDLQAVFFGLIQSQTERVMLAEVRSEYVFKTIDPAFPPENKVSPNRALICVAGAVLGSIFGVMLAFLRYYVRKKIAVNS